jgi:hypothetical protein
MARQVNTYKVRFIFFKLYKSIQVTATSVKEAETIVCEKYQIPKALKINCHFYTTLVK